MWCLLCLFIGFFLGWCACALIAVGGAMTTRILTKEEAAALPAALAGRGSDFRIITGGR